jgi:hypothetical protein
VGDGESRDAAQRGEDEAFNQELRHETRATHAEREAERNLAPAGERPGEEQVGDVGARDEEHDDGDPAHPGGDARDRGRGGTALEENRPRERAGADRFFRWHRRILEALVVEAHAERVGEVRVRLRDGHRLFATRDHVVPGPAVRRPPAAPSLESGTGGVACDRDERDRRCVLPEADEAARGYTYDDVLCGADLE